MLILIIVLLLLFGGLGGGYWDRGRLDAGGSFYRGGGIGLGTVLVIVLIFWLLTGGRFQ